MLRLEVRVISQSVCATKTPLRPAGDAVVTTRRRELRLPSFARLNPFAGLQDVGYAVGRE